MTSSLHKQTAHHLRHTNIVHTRRRDAALKQQVCAVSVRRTRCHKALLDEAEDDRIQIHQRVGQTGTVAFWIVGMLYSANVRTVQEKTLKATEPHFIRCVGSLSVSETNTRRCLLQRVANACRCIKPNDFKMRPIDGQIAFDALKIYRSGVTLVTVVACPKPESAGWCRCSTRSLARWDSDRPQFPPLPAGSSGLPECWRCAASANLATLFARPTTTFGPSAWFVCLCMLLSARVERDVCS